MTGKTHMTSSLLCSSFLLRINPVNFIYTPFLILGALICDVDAEYSMIQKITYIIFYAMIGVFIIYKNANITTIVSVIMIIALSVYAKKRTEHRTFTHSILGFVLYSICVFFINTTGAIYFIIGYISHLILDSFTNRGVMILYPIDKMFRIGSFKIDKATDYTINLITMLLTMYLVLI